MITGTYTAGGPARPPRAPVRRALRRRSRHQAPTLLLISLVAVFVAACGAPAELRSVEVDLAGYQIRSTYSEGLAIIAPSSDTRHGFVDTRGVIVIQPRYFQVGRFAGGLAPVRESPWTPWGYIDRTGATVIEARFDAALPFSEGLAPVRVGDHWGYIDRTGAYRIPPRFHSAWGFSGGLARVAADGLAGYIDPDGAWVAEPAFFRAGDFQEERAFVCGPRTCGYLDERGAVAIDFRFDDAGSFSAGLAPVRIGPHWGYIDRSGELVIPAVFTEAEPFTEGLGRVGQVREFSYHRKFGGYSGRKVFSGFVEQGGSLAFNTRIHGATPFSQGLTVVRLPTGGLCSDCNHYRLMGRNGRFLPGRFDSATPPAEGIAIVTVRGRSYTVDLDGKPILRFDRSIPSDPDDSARQAPRARYGYIDPGGNVVLPPIYSMAHPFSEGLAFVEIPRERQPPLRRFVDRQGVLVVELPRTVATVLPYTHGLALAGTWIDGALRYGFLDRNGDMAIPARFFSAAPFSEGLAVVKHSRDLSVNDWGYVDTGGNTVIEPRFHAAGSFSQGLAPARWLAPPNTLVGGVIDRTGRVVVTDPFPGLSGPFEMRTPSLESWYRRADASLGEGLVPVSRGARLGWIDARGGFVPADPKVVSLGVFSEGLAPAATADNGLYGLRWGFADTAGRMAIEPRFANVHAFREGLALVHDLAGRTGFVTPDGKLAIQPMWLEDAQPFAGGLAPVKLNGRWGYLDRNGDLAIPPKFSAAAPFSEGLATVCGAGHAVSTQFRP